MLNSNKNFLHILQDKKYSIATIAYFFILSSSFLYILVLLHHQNTQIEHLLTTYQELIKSNQELTQIAQQRDLELESLKMQISKVSIVPEAIDPSVLQSNNDMKKYYLNVALLVFGGLLTVGIVANFFNVFSFHAWIPASVYKFIQNQTFFFQDAKTFTSVDPLLKMEWVVNTIHNEKVVNVLLKEASTGNLIDASKFLASLINMTAQTDVVAAAYAASAGSTTCLAITNAVAGAVTGSTSTALATLANATASSSTAATLAAANVATVSSSQITQSLLCNFY